MDRQGVVVVNGLSCTNCRGKKLRCSRDTPVCERCSTLNLPCQYPQRRPRTSKRKDANHHNADNDNNYTLSLILDRLQRIEKGQSSVSRSSPTSADSASQQPEISETLDGDSPASSLLAVNDNVRNSVSASSPTPITRLQVTPLASDGALPALRPAALGATPHHPASLDVASTLSDTFDRVRDKRLKRSLGVNVVATEGIDISPEKAKTWIHNYFTYSPTETFLSLVDRKTIELIPDMLLMRHVTLDPCILIIYFVILWRGCYILNTRTFHSPDGKYSRQLYLCCLRTIPSWQREATGSITDFIAAIFMTGVATECFDFEMSLEMHHLACEYAKGLHLHSLDGNDYFAATGSTRTDDDRKGMWELIQKDLFYHLIYNKPATLYPSLDKWRVNLPWLSLDSPPENVDNVSTISFLVRSRLTFILIHFFHTLEKLEHESEAVGAIEPLCHEVELLFEEWGIENWIQRSLHDQMDLWILAELVLAGYTSIIFMLRKATLLKSNCPNPVSSDVNIPKTDYATRASRRILELTYSMMHVWRFPAAELISYILGAYRAHIAYSHLASNVISSLTTAEMVEDLQLLDRVAQGMGTAAQQESDFFPLARAMQEINAEVRKRVGV
ncbi:hypothetical protein CH35J_009322 [Colletotrichum higginsianum]|uniref:Zn(2)-C6 fungal-type domain-containing protein n=1 Tax=Colletotrichum higginsianum TaxID=80884 RepID=A0A4T0VN08_9PEZI|nr:hypothetical protein CH35J_009322 [Colletotrichum higginsianum]